MNSDTLTTGRQAAKDENPFRMAPLQRDGIFSYQTIHGEKWGVRFPIQRRTKSWRGFPDQASAQAFRDEMYEKKKTGRLVSEKYYLTNGGELLSTTIDYYLSTIEGEKSAYEERQYGAVWKELFPCATVKSFTVEALQRARKKLKYTGGEERSDAEVNVYMTWLGTVLNHAIARGLTTTNVVTNYRVY